MNTLFQSAKLPLQWLCAFPGILLFPVHHIFAQEVLIFSTSPVYSSEYIQKLYDPLIDYLSSTTGQDILFLPAEDRSEYEERIKDGRYDLIFDAAHIVDWSVQELGFQVMVKMDNDQRFVVITHKKDNINSISQLQAETVCAISSPNLLSLGFMDEFRKSGGLPYFVGGESTDEIMECLLQNNGKAAVVQEQFWKNYRGKRKNELFLTYRQQRAFPGHAFSISSEVDVSIRKKIISALLSDEARKFAKSILQSLGGSKFETADSIEYENLSSLLNLVWNE